MKTNLPKSTLIQQNVNQYFITIYTRLRKNQTNKYPFLKIKSTKNALRINNKINLYIV